MGRIEDIIAQKKALDEELEIAMAQEREAVIADVRQKIIHFKITATELKGLIKGRVTKKQVEEFIKRKGTNIGKSKMSKI